MSGLRSAAAVTIVLAVLASCSSPGGGSTNPPQIPAAPTGVVASDTTSQNTITWNTSSGATSYNVYRSTTSGVTKTSGAKTTAAKSPYADTSVANGTTYYYVITAVSSDGESSESSQVSATPLGIPSGLNLQTIQVMTETSPEPNLFWNAVPGAQSYNVYYSDGSKQPLDGTRVTNATSGTGCIWRLGSVPNTYRFAVSAVNSGGESALSTTLQGP